jgi:hypothetical protein
MPRIPILIGILASLLTGSCAYRQGMIEAPFVRNYQYFSYVAGDDIRRDCRPGTAAQYRFVYNAIWGEQVRAYDLRRSATGEGAILWSEVFEGGGVLSALNTANLLSSKRDGSGRIRLSEAEYVALIRAVEASGFGAPAPQGLALPSWAFSWVAAACANGRFHLNAWRYPSERFAQIQFAQTLFRYDPSSIEVNPPRPTNETERAAPPGAEREPRWDFVLRVGENDLSGRAGSF